eukprot:m.480685 g.480685  ORF g.480685 m.480685 type:complete len:110 (-) comp21710_c1_seq1:1219-1548(-)
MCSVNVICWLLVWMYSVNVSAECMKVFWKCCQLDACMRVFWQCCLLNAGIHMFYQCCLLNKCIVEQQSFKYKLSTFGCVLFHAFSSGQVGGETSRASRTTMHTLGHRWH